MAPIPGDPLQTGQRRPPEWASAAVERQLEIVGEALNRLTREDPSLAGRIPDVGRIVGFRNVLARGYDIVDPGAVWKAITIELPNLVDTVTALLAELDDSVAG